MMRTLAISALATALAGPATAQAYRAGQLDAYVPIEITSAPTTAAAGVLSKNAVVAQRTVVARDAVVTLDEVKAKNRIIPAGTVMARVEEAAGGKVLWCDMRRMSVFNTDSVDCLDDSDGDGRLDRLDWGWTAGRSGIPFNIVKVTHETPAPAAIRVRPATADERPSATIGYQFCKSDLAVGPPRFAFAMTIPDWAWQTGDMSCPFGVWSDEAAGIAKVDAIELRVSRGDKPTYEVVRDYRAGSLGPIVPGASLAAAVERQTPQAQAAAHRAEVRRSPLKAVGAPTVRAGAVERGEAFLSIPVSHAITGRLKNPVKARGLFATKVALPVGQAVYGIPMTGDALIWCAPRETAVSNGVRGYSTVCLPQAGGGYRWEEVSPPLFVTEIITGGYGSFADAPTVEPGPVDFGVPMTLVYRYAGPRGDRIYVREEVRTDLGTTVIGERPLPKLSGGFALLPAMGGALKITPSADGKTANVEVAVPLSQTGEPLL